MAIGPKGSKSEIGFKKFIFFLLWVGRLIGGKVSKLENDLKFSTLVSKECSLAMANLMGRQMGCPMGWYLDHPSGR